MEENISFYKTILNEWLAIDRTDKDKHKVFYSPDGTSFLQLYINGLSTSNGDVTNYTVENPHVCYDWFGKISLIDKGFVMKIDGSKHNPIFRLCESPAIGTWRIIRLPKTRELLGIYALPDGQIICWMGDKYEFSYETISVYLGAADDLHKVMVYKADMYGFVTKEGDLDLENLRFEGYKLTMLVRSDYVFVEIDAGLKITKKTKGA